MRGYSPSRSCHQSIRNSLDWQNLGRVSLPDKVQRPHVNPTDTTDFTETPDFFDFRTWSKPKHKASGGTWWWAHLSCFGSWTMSPHQRPRSLGVKLITTFQAGSGSAKLWSPSSWVPGRNTTPRQSRYTGYTMDIQIYIHESHHADNRYIMHTFDVPKKIVPHRSFRQGPVIL